MKTLSTHWACTFFVHGMHFFRISQTCSICQFNICLLLCLDAFILHLYFFLLHSFECFFIWSLKQSDLLFITGIMLHTLSIKDEQDLKRQNWNFNKVHSKALKNKEYKLAAVITVIKLFSSFPSGSLSLTSSLVECIWSWNGFQRPRTHRVWIRSVKRA